jgi:hypothetical protein
MSGDGDGRDLNLSGAKGIQVGPGNIQFNYFYGRQASDGPARVPPSELLADVTDPFALEVHRPVQPDEPPLELPDLPAYVPRDVDRQLAGVVRAAGEGRSGIAVLVGGSSTGKTRACWEALRLLRGRPEPWRLWHPIDPSRPEAALGELPLIGPWTVVWLNEAQFYLDVAANGLGERIAAGLRNLLHEPDHAPILILATLWPEYWGQLTTRPAARTPDPHEQARELLAGPSIPVPAALTAAEQEMAATARDLRLSLAAAEARDGRVIQFLAGARELIVRYETAPAGARALLDAALDARRMGMGPALPRNFLEVATPHYLSDADWDELGRDWPTRLREALTYTAAQCKGISGPLSPLLPRPGDDAFPAGQVYRLADYLEQRGRHDRRACFPPPGFWKAAASHANPGDLPALAEAAQSRGLLRVAARLRKHAARHGNTREAATLVGDLNDLHSSPASYGPAQWAVTYASLDDPSAVAILLRALRGAGADRHAAALAARAAASVPLDDPGAVAHLLNSLQKKGDGAHAAVLVARDPATSVSLEYRHIEDLLHALRRAGEGGQVAALAARAAASVPLDDPYSVADLLNTLRQVGEIGHAVVLAPRAAVGAALDRPSRVAHLLDALGVIDAPVLAARAAADAALDSPSGIVSLLHALRRTDEEQVAVLAARAAADVPFNHPDLGSLLNCLTEVGEGRQIAALAGRVPVNDPSAVADLLHTLWWAGECEQVVALAARAAAGSSLDDPGAVVDLLHTLWDVGKGRQIAADIPPDDPSAVADLLLALREVGEGRSIAALAVASVPLSHPSAVAFLIDALWEMGEAGQVAVLAGRDPAASVPLSHPSAVALLIDTLWEAGEERQVAALAARDPAASVPLNHPHAIALLLHTLRRVGEDRQVAALAARAAAGASLGNPGAVANLLLALREIGEGWQVAALAARAAADAPLNHLHLETLLNALQEAGEDRKVGMLISRLPAEGRFMKFREQPGYKALYWFGREPDESPAPSWGWDDLD